MTPTTERQTSTGVPFDLGGCPRRNVLRAMGVVAIGAGGVGTLAACASDDSGTAPSTGASSAPASSASSAAASPSASSSASSSSGSSSSAAVPDGVKVAKSEIPEGGGIVLSDADYVVTQPTKGVYKAFSKRCTHQGNPVGSIEGTNILCPFHGSEFSITDGSVTHPPATQPLPEFTVVESGSDIVIVA